MAEESVHRRLAAIVIADVVGYSRLMEKDAAGTRQCFLAIQKDIVEPILDDHQGRIVKTMGDGFLIEFSSVVSAVAASVQFQRRMAEHQTDLPSEDRMQFRIGVNTGEIIVEGEDIHGEGVNVAARLEALAEPGGILISGRVHEQLHDAVDSGYAFIGEQQVKNVARPVPAYKVLLDPSDAGKGIARTPAPQKSSLRKLIPVLAVLLVAALGGLGWFVFREFDEGGRAADSKTDGVPRLAVLPFENLSSDAQQAYFAQGIAADLIVDLSKLRGIRVISRKSSFGFPSTKAKLSETVRKLGIRYVVSGSVRRHASTLRINAQLIDMAKDDVVWGHRFDGKTKDVFKFQDQIVGQIVRQLRQKLSPAEAAAIARRGTSSPEAYDAFVLGMRLNASQRDLDTKNNEAAIAAFRKAIHIDPKYGRAFAGLAWAHWLNYTKINSNGSGGYRAFAMAEKSLKLQKSALAYRVIAKKHFALGIPGGTKRRPDLAIANLNAAARLEPNNPDVLADLADVLSFVGRGRMALTKIKEAIRLNPRHPNWYYRPLGIAQFVNGKYEASARSFERLLATARGFAVRYYVWRAAALALAGQVDLARKVFKEQRPRMIYAAHTVQAIGREWPLPQKEREILFRGLRLAGVPEEPVRK